MREARMTFGEHLEELRRRIIFALVYLAVGVGVSLTYGTQLMGYVLEPHFRAIRGAKREQLVLRMEKAAGRLDSLISVVPRDSASAEPPLVEGEIHWEVLYLGEVALPQLYRRLEAPALEAARGLGERLGRLVRERLSELGVPDAAQELAQEAIRAVEESFSAYGKESARVLVSEFAPELEREAYSRIPDRFRDVVARLEKFETEGGLGVSKVQSMIGWSRDLSSVLGPLRRFVEFLEQRKEQAMRSGVPLDVLRQRAAASRLPVALDQELQKIEADSRSLTEGIQARINVISYTENFAAYLKIAFIIGAMIALPGILYEIWKFVGAGLYAHEQKYVVTVLPFSLLLFAVGILFGYFLLIPVGLRFLAGWGVQEVELTFTLGSYVGLFFTLTLILGLIFQLPLVMIFLGKIGIVTVAGFRKWRRAAIFIGVILAVVLTPPDPFSWALMAAPMVLLYEVGILACAVLARPRPAT